MTLIKSISGIRGTIGGTVGDSLTPIDIVKFSAAFGTFLLEKKLNKKVVIGRDARPSGGIVSSLVSATLQSLGLDVVDLGLATTPTVEMAVVWEQASGGIILTASHNPIEWNALKLLNEKGEFISDAEGKNIIDKAEQDNYQFVEVLQLGHYRYTDIYLQKHIDAIKALHLVDADAIKAANFNIVLDAVNSVGGLAIPPLLEALGVQHIEKLYCEPTGLFPHNPEPLPENLTDISNVLKKGGHTLGIVVDPDVDRLAFVNEDGSMFGEEYTLVAVSDYILQHHKGATVSNLSSTLALKDITELLGQKYFSAAVGEVNVVAKMKEVQAVIGGEGNGGIIYPELHYGRDALVGVALFLSYLAKTKLSMTALKAKYPKYEMLKTKIQLAPNTNVDHILAEVVKNFQGQEINQEDGVKIFFDKSWVQLRKSNTEPIIRLYAEATEIQKAQTLIDSVNEVVKEALK